MNIGDLEKWVDYSTPIKGIVNDELNNMEKWVDYSTPPSIFNISAVDVSMNAIFFSMNF